MIRKLLASCRKLDPDGEIDLFVAGVSGGADSTALLYCLHEIQERLGVRVEVVHVNHKARGKDSEEDAAFVRRMCRRLGVKCSVKSVNVAAAAKKKGISFEMAAREARYNCFAAAAKKSDGVAAIVTAHTRDDVAETVLLKLARGAGIRGLAGIPARGEYKGIAVLRPLLDVSRDEVVSFLRRRKIEWREDLSNLSPDYLRNRVRHRVLPVLEAELNPNVRTALIRTAEVLREDDALLQSLTDEALKACSLSSRELSLDELRQEHRALVRRVLMTWLTDNGVNSQDLDLGLIGEIEKIVVSRKANACMKISGGLYVVREYDRLCIGRTKKAPVPEFSESFKVPGRLLIEPIGLMLEVFEGKGVIRERGRPGDYPARATISRKAVGRKKLTVRSWRAGDRIKPMGMDGSKKVKDILINLKIPARVRAMIPVVECGGEIVWLPGYRVARGWEVGKAEHHSLALTLKSL